MNGIKTFDLVQQLILGVQRDLILQSWDFQSLNGDFPLKTKKLFLKLKISWRYYTSCAVQVDHRSLHGYPKFGKLYAFCQLWKLKTIAFKINFKKMEGPMFPVNYVLIIIALRATLKISQVSKLKIVALGACFQIKIPSAHSSVLNFRSYCFYCELHRAC